MRILFWRRMRNSDRAGFKPALVYYVVFMLKNHNIVYFLLLIYNSLWYNSFGKFCAFLRIDGYIL